MRLAVLAVGRLKEGAERTLAARYANRIEALGPSLGFSPLEVIEIAEGRARQAAERRAEEAAVLLARSRGAVLVAFDERGAGPTSEAFSARIGAWRDQGRPALAFAIGGPDGLGDAVRAGAELVVCFGRLTLPHQLVRVLVLEQVYRALTILGRHPYHRA